jgi:type I restriction enzyme, S subunit
MGVMNRGDAASCPAVRAEVSGGEGMNEWKEQKISDMVKFSTGKLNSNAEATNGKYPFFTCSPETLRINDYAFDCEALLLAGNNADGNFALKYFNGKFNAYQRTYIITIPDTNLLSYKYLFYSLKTKLADLKNISAGSATRFLTLTILNEIEIPLPGIEEQKAIASVLSSLDDKIDLLHRQNKTLEAIPETLFRQWFIEEAQTDWEEGTLGSIAKNIRNAVKPTDIQADSKYIGLEHIDRRSITLKQYGLGDEVSSNKYSFEERDILFGKLRPYFHKVCFTPFSGICSTDILVVRSKHPDWFAFCLFAFFQDDVVEYANLGSGGTRMPRTDWGTLRNYPISIPDIESLTQFNNLVLPSIEKMTYNLDQIQTLEKLRNTLLPKLMSGEVRTMI